VLGELARSGFTVTLVAWLLIRTSHTKDLSDFAQHAIDFGTTAVAGIAVKLKFNLPIQLAKMPHQRLRQKVIAIANGVTRVTTRRGTA
jgi:hypothetical protein